MTTQSGKSGFNSAYITDMIIYQSILLLSGVTVIGEKESFDKKDIVNLDFIKNHQYVECSGIILPSGDIISMFDKNNNQSFDKISIGSYDIETGKIDELVFNAHELQNILGPDVINNKKYIDIISKIIWELRDKFKDGQIIYPSDIADKYDLDYLSVVKIMDKMTDEGYFR